MRHKLEDFDWKDIQSKYDSGLTQKQLIENGIVTDTMIRRARENGLITVRNSHPISEEVKKVLSEKQKKYMKANPEKHPWRNGKRTISKPCEKMKDRLRKEGLNFVEEYMPLDNRLFSIDIAFPDKKFAVEINGPFHYDKDGKLKPYYQERHDLIEADGWKVVEVFCNLVYNEEYVNSLIREIRGLGISNEVDYSSYLKERQENKRLKEEANKTFCKKCGKTLSRGANCRVIKTGLCSNCHILYYLVNKVDKETLKKRVMETSIFLISKEYGVTEVTIRRWLKKFGIIKSRGKLVPRN